MLKVLVLRKLNDDKGFDILLILLNLRDGITILDRGFFDKLDHLVA